MRFKLPNVFRNKKPETKPTGPSAAELLDAFYGKPNNPKPSYYDKREKSVQDYLKQLEKLNPEAYDYYQQKLDEVRKARSGTFKDIVDFDRVIDEIEGLNLVWERVLVNVELGKIIRNMRQYFNRAQAMVIVGDIILGSHEKELMNNILRGDDVFLKEEELFKRVPEWEPLLKECREEYDSFLTEANYQMSMLSLMDGLLNHDYETRENPFSDYMSHRATYRGFLYRDIKALRARAKIFQNSCSQKSKSGTNYRWKLNENMKELDDAIFGFEVDSSFHLYNIIGVQEDDVKTDFYKLAKKYVKASIALNRAEYDELMDTIDRFVRNKAANIPTKEEPKIESDELIGAHREAQINDALSQLKEEDYKEKIPEKKSAEEAFYYQLNLARKVGLITDDNWIEAMPIKECRTNATISMIKKAQAAGSEIIVFPPLDDDRQKHNAFRVYTKNKMVRSTKLQYPFSIMQANRKKSVDFLVKIPEAYVEEFKNSLYQGGINAEMIEKNMCYTFDKETGIYNFYINKEKTSSYNPEEFKKSANKAGIHLLEDIYDDDFKKPIYLGVRFRGDKDIISVLKDLYAYGVRYFLDYDSTTSVGNIYYDPSRENDVKEALQDYRYIDFRGDNEGDPHRADLRCDKESIENILKVGYIYDTGPDEPKGDREMD